MPPTKFLTIAVTSYSRVSELERCLLSIDASMIEDIEVIVSEDCSPKKIEITALVARLSASSKFHLKFNSNHRNLGYDKNIKKLIDLASGEYILFITDDDQFSSGALDEVISHLKKNRPAFLLTPYKHVKSDSRSRTYSKSHVIPCGIQSIKKYVFDSILVSGLIFKRALIPCYHEDKFDKLIYSQVYIFCGILLNDEGAYFEVNLIDCVEDGENAYGKSESNINEYLSDRSKPISNLEFNKGLLQIIRIFDFDHDTSLHKLFSSEYCFRSWTGLAESKRISQHEMKAYFYKLRSLDVAYSAYPYIYFIVLSCLGYSLSQFLLFIPKFFTRKVRSLVTSRR